MADRISGRRLPVRRSELGGVGDTSADFSAKDIGTLDLNIIVVQHVGSKSGDIMPIYA